jgi:hypothetical protein
MLMVPHYVSQSCIHGIGVFALEGISEGELVWEMVVPIDKTVSFDEFDALPVVARHFYREIWLFSAWA